jgi:hypothetical protein
MPIVLKSKKKNLKDKSNLEVNRILIDGQHRRKALEVLISNNIYFTLEVEEKHQLMNHKIFIHEIKINNFIDAKNIYMKLNKSKPFTKADYIQLEMKLNNERYRPKKEIETIITKICSQYKSNYTNYNLVKKVFFNKIYIDKLKTELSNNDILLKLLHEYKLKYKDVLDIFDIILNNIKNKINNIKDNKKKFKKYIKQNFCGINDSFRKNIVNNHEKLNFCIYFFHPDYYSYFINNFLNEIILEKYDPFNVQDFLNI